VCNGSLEAVNLPDGLLERLSLVFRKVGRCQLGIEFSPKGETSFGTKRGRLYFFQRLPQCYANIYEPLGFKLFLEGFK
jgi:hypothetical protein